MNRPLADRIRPRSLDEVEGQRHILGEGKVLRRAIESGRIGNMIFHGPSGTGKTTVANIAAASSNRKFHKLNATNAGVSDVKAVIAELGGFSAQNGILLYLDEIQNFNKKQQQSLLEVIETGDVVLIASTAENPYFYVYNAILSRSAVFEFKPLTKDDIEKTVRRAIEVLKGDFPGYTLVFEDSATEHIAVMANGDARRAVNATELCAYTAVPDEKNVITVSLDLAEQASQKKAMTYDRLGDNHYDILSAFQKSIRGSDPDASLHYLARLVAAEDLPSICRRLMVIASEDVGLAYPLAVTIVKSCVDCALALGFPEARIPLAEAVILLATAPKSNSVVRGIDAAMGDIESIGVGEVPDHLRDSHYDGAKKLGRGEGYKYPHDFPNNYVMQQYLPDILKDRKYYTPGENKFEESLKEYWRRILT
ncbi:MAG: Replication-associated recombination protein A [Firmicutes bacterium ADurb.Bin193]|nr:MAG: Replication-associated recombination protein A [Firmicutes bacterium ADurb.Bin193]